jgi:putative salt-induced outer membrane protein YdiY
MTIRTPVALLGAVLIAGTALAQSPSPQAGDRVDVTLSSGDIIRGTIVSQDGQTLVLSHPVLGQLSVARANVTAVVPTPPPPPGSPTPPPPPVPGEPAKVAAPAAPSAPAPPAPGATTPDKKAPEVKQDPQSFWEGWTGSVEGGLNGAAGNSESLSFRVGATAKRETSKVATTAALAYQYGTQNGDKNVDKGTLDLRNDWKITPPWRVFAAGKVEYDQFQDWDWRVSGVVGLGYEFIKTDRTLLLGRVGVGASKEFGGSDNRIKPELDFGLDLEHKIDERQKLTASLDYFPSLLNFPSDYRVVGKAAYEVVIDEKNNLSLKLGLEDVYQSRPGAGKKRDDLTYFLVAVYKF